MAIVITSTTQGILFDLTAEAGALKPNYVFRPAHFSSIIKLSVYNNRVEYMTVNGIDFIFSWDGSEGYQAISTINGVATESNQDLFDKLKALM